MLLDGVTGEAKLLEDSRLDFTDMKTVLVKKDLYTFNEEDDKRVFVHKISQYASTESLVKTLLSALPSHEQLHCFSVSYWAAAGGIVLTGGRNDGINGRTNSAKTYMLAVETDRWMDD